MNWQLYQFPKISNNASTDQPISDEFGTLPWLFPTDPEMSRNILYCVRGQEAAPNRNLEDTFTAFSRSQPGLMYLCKIGELTSSSRLTLCTALLLTSILQRIS